MKIALLSLFAPRADADITCSRSIEQVTDTMKVVTSGSPLKNAEFYGFVSADGFDIKFNPNFRRIGPRFHSPFIPTVSAFMYKLENGTRASVSFKLPAFAVVQRGLLISIFGAGAIAMLIDAILNSSLPAIVGASVCLAVIMVLEAVVRLTFRRFTNKIHRRLEELFEFGLY